ncbi:WfeP [Zunongwangia profunda SM-A87]|uniref:WfeP n=1 Tax=Zunongwangia profunda (strain DSM 18752 / CCTCC AB 206139 / SM-A87) TaxID=655815 RepID=D5BFH1_ZUNPS|nr:WfeP [Zunongwangia profunda SM-A87]
MLKWKTMRALSYLPIFRVLPLVSVETFKRKYIKDFTKDIYTDQALKNVIDRERFRGYVVGSDQIWNYTAAPQITDAFLSFVTDKSDIKRVSYAASFGREQWKYPETETKECKNLVQQFDGVSVREKSGVTLCKDFLGVDANHHLDPTMLLSKEDYIDIIESSKVAPSNGKLLLYILDATEERQKIVNAVQKELNLEPYGIRQFKKIKILKNALKGIYPSVQQWLKSFYDAEFVVTDSFHGTIFSIIFNKPFISLGNKERGMARFESLLSDLGLLSRLVTVSDQVTVEMIRQEIDWDLVDAKIAKAKDVGIDYLNEKLK